MRVNRYGFGPATTKQRTTEHLSDDSIGDIRPAVRVQRAIRSARIFLFGVTHEEVRRPTLTKSDYFWVILILHVNIRFMTRYIDLCLEWGGRKFNPPKISTAIFHFLYVVLVWTVYMIANVTICPWLAFIFAFIGGFGDRSYLMVWDMMPLFTGIAYSLTIFEVFMVIETSMITCSGAMAFIEHMNFALTWKPATEPYICNKTTLEFEVATGVPYEMSQWFTLIGHTPEETHSDKLLDWSLDYQRVKYLCGVYGCVMFFRTFQFKRYRFYPLRFNMYKLLVIVFTLCVTYITLDQKPLAKIVQYDLSSFTNPQPYLNTIIFAMSDFGPMHWVTFGYLSKGDNLVTKIWINAFIKIVVAFVLLFWLPFVANDFMEYVNAQRVECLEFFGMHFFFVMVPISIKRYWMTAAVPVWYMLYFGALILNGISYILVTVELFVYSFMAYRSALFRYRNLINMILFLILLGLNTIFCIKNAHYLFFYVNIKSHYYTTLVLSTLTTIALAIYSVDRINGDHMFMYGVRYPFTLSLKLTFLMTYGLVLLFGFQIFFNQYRPEHDNNIYWIITGVCFAPLPIGIWHVYSHKAKLHGYLQPKSIWGRPKTYKRNQRRCKTIHTMYTYRMERECFHNCLISNQVYREQVDSNLCQQEKEIGLFRADLMQMKIDRVEEDVTSLDSA